MKTDVTLSEDSVRFTVEGADYLSAKELGAVGEKLATAWLCDRGWQLLGVNVQVGHCEIDALFETVELRNPSWGPPREVRVLVVVEVKSRRTSTAGSGAEALSHRKRASLRKAIGRWLHEHDYQCDEIRFDVIECEVHGNRELACRRIEDAF